MSKLHNLIFTEKYRPSDFDNLIFQYKEDVLKFLKQGKGIPSFIFYSPTPGTGKTTLAKLIIKKLECDSLPLNSSEERGIDTIRDKITGFAMALSSTKNKRCVFLDEADGLTRPAQDSMRNLMESYSDNVFFILSCNDINKIIEPIRSRCQIYNFETPDKNEIIRYLQKIGETEKIGGDLESLCEYYYPDIRSMVKAIQEVTISGKPWNKKQLDYELFLEALINKNTPYIMQVVYSGEFDLLGWNKWFFKYIFDNYESYGLERCKKIALYLADIEKYVQLGSNMEIVFLSNILQIMEILTERG